MSEDTVKITADVKSVKVKDPKRVAAGKKLAEISKVAKEKKMREMIVNEERGEWNYGYIIGTLGVIIAGVSLWCAIRSGVEKKEVTTTAVTDSRPILDTFDS